VSNVSPSGSGHRSAVDMMDSPVDLSQSAANFKTQPNTAAANISQGCPSGVSASAYACGASFFCSENPVSRSVSHESWMLPTVWGSDVSSVNSLPLNSTCKLFPVRNDGVNQNNLTADIRHSAGGSLVNFHSSAVKSNSSAQSVNSFGEKNSTGNSESESDSSVPYPKTKKQKAVDSKASSLTDSLSATVLDGNISEYEPLTFGEIQERLITRVVESGSLSGVLCDERRRLIGANQHHAAGSLPLGQFSSPNRPCLAPERTSSEHCNMRTVSSLPMTSWSSFPTKQKSVTSTAQGLSLHYATSD